MKYHWDKKYLYWGVTSFIVIALSILFYYGIFHIKVLGNGLSGLVGILMPIIYGLIIGYILTPVVTFLENKVFFRLAKRLKINRSSNFEKRVRSISIVLTLLAMLLIIYGLLNLLIPQLIKSIQTIIQGFPGYYKNFQEWFSNVVAGNSILENSTSAMITNASDYFQSWLNGDLLPKINTALVQISTGFMDFVNVLKNMVIGIIISIYVMSSKETFAAQAKKILYAAMEPHKANDFINSMRFVNRTFIRYISGALTDSTIVGIICFIVTSILDIPYGVLISVIIGCTNIIPFFGPYIGGIPSAFLILMVDPVKCLYFIIFIVLMQLVDGNIIAPKILGDSTGLSSFWVVFAILIGGGIFGIPGMFIGVPVFAVIYAFVRLMVDKALKSRRFPEDTASYLDLERIDTITHEFIRSEAPGSAKKEIETD